MKNNDKTEATKENADNSIWNFEFEWTEIDFNWSTDDYLCGIKKNREDNVKEGVKNCENHKGNRIKTGE